MNFFKRCGIKSRTNPPNISPTLSLPHGKHQRAEVFSRSARLGKANNHHFLSLSRLYLEPFAGALARVVESRRPLCDDAFEFLFLSLFEKFCAKFPSMRAVSYP